MNKYDIVDYHGKTGIIVDKKEGQPETYVVMTDGLRSRHVQAQLSKSKFCKNMRVKTPKGNGSIHGMNHNGRWITFPNNYVFETTEVTPLFEVGTVVKANDTGKYHVKGMNGYIGKVKELQGCDVILDNHYTYHQDDIEPYRAETLPNDIKVKITKGPYKGKVGTIAYLTVGERYFVKGDNFREHFEKWEVEEYKEEIKWIPQVGDIVQTLKEAPCKSGGIVKGIMWVDTQLNRIGIVEKTSPLKIRVQGIPLWYYLPEWCEKIGEFKHGQVTPFGIVDTIRDGEVQLKCPGMEVDMCYNYLALFNKIKEYEKEHVVTKFKVGDKVYTKDKATGYFSFIDNMANYTGKVTAVELDRKIPYIRLDNSYAYSPKDVFLCKKEEENKEEESKFKEGDRVRIISKAHLAINETSELRSHFNESGRINKLVSSDVYAVRLDGTGETLYAPISCIEPLMFKEGDSVKVFDFVGPGYNGEIDQFTSFMQREFEVEKVRKHMHSDVLVCKHLGYVYEFDWLYLNPKKEKGYGFVSMKSEPEPAKKEEQTMYNVGDRVRITTHVKLCKEIGDTQAYHGYSATLKENKRNDVFTAIVDATNELVYLHTTWMEPLVFKAGDKVRCAKDGEFYVHWGITTKMQDKEFILTKTVEDKVWENRGLGYYEGWLSLIPTKTTEEPKEPVKEIEVPIKQEETLVLSSLDLKVGTKVRVTGGRYKGEVGKITDSFNTTYIILTPRHYRVVDKVDIEVYQWRLPHIRLPQMKLPQVPQGKQLVLGTTKLVRRLLNKDSV